MSSCDGSGCPGGRHVWCTASDGQLRVWTKSVYAFCPSGRLLDSGESRQSSRKLTLYDEILQKRFCRLHDVAVSEEVDLYHGQMQDVVRREVATDAFQLSFQTNPDAVSG
jgi:hypothetical protein